MAQVSVTEWDSGAMREQQELQQQQQQQQQQGEEEEEEEEEDDQEVSDNPLPAWMEGDSLAPPCQADMDVVRAIIDFVGVTEDDVSLCYRCGGHFKSAFVFLGVRRWPMCLFSAVDVCIHRANPLIGEIATAETERQSDADL